MAVLFFNFSEEFHTASTAAALIYISTNHVDRFLSPISSPAFVVFVILMTAVLTAVR
jgi:hypothetical protein